MTAMTPRPRLHTAPQRRLAARQRSQLGGLLIEGMVSIVLISLAALAVVGLQAHAIRIDNDAQYRHVATLVAADLAAEMLLTKTEKNDTDTGPWSAHLDKLPNAQIVIADAPTTEPLTHSWVKDVTVTWMPPSKTGTERESLMTRLTIPKGTI